jgi:predicted nucleotidyltransferase
VTLTPAQIAALRELEQVFVDRSIVIIGATALGFYYDMAWRKTADLDLLVAVELDQFPGGLAEREGWEQRGNKEHEFLAPNSVKLDVLPAGPDILEQGEITWDCGHVMNMAGMGLAFEHAAAHTVDDYDARVAPPHIVAVLKMTAYMDRPDDRLRDLEDIAHLLDIYVDDDSERRWDEAADVEEFELAPAYLLGLDMAAIAADSHRELTEGFLCRVADPDHTAHAQMRQRGPNSWNGHTDPLAKRLDAFRAGLAGSRDRDR